MPKIKTKRAKAAPEGFKQIEPTLNEFQEKLKDIESSKNKSALVKSKKESLWPIFQIYHQRSRYIYELYYQKKLISNDLYQYLLKNKYADGLLIAKWRKQGYENLCCLTCITSNETHHGSTCICRVPKANLVGQEKKDGRCINCGCRGCSSSD